MSSALVLNRCFRVLRTAYKSPLKKVVNKFKSLRRRTLIVLSPAPRPRNALKLEVGDNADSWRLTQGEEAWDLKDVVAMNFEILGNNLQEAITGQVTIVLRSEHSSNQYAAWCMMFVFAIMWGWFVWQAFGPVTSIATLVAIGSYCLRNNEVPPSFSMAGIAAVLWLLCYEFAPAFLPAYQTAFKAVSVLLISTSDPVALFMINNKHLCSFA